MPTLKGSKAAFEAIVAAIVRCLLDAGVVIGPKWSFSTPL